MGCIWQMVASEDIGRQILTYGERYAVAVMVIFRFWLFYASGSCILTIIFITYNFLIGSYLHLSPSQFSEWKYNIDSVKSSSGVVVFSMIFIFILVTSFCSSRSCGTMPPHYPFRLAPISILAWIWILTASFSKMPFLPSLGDWSLNVVRNTFFKSDVTIYNICWNQSL